LEYGVASDGEFMRLKRYLPAIPKELELILAFALGAGVVACGAGNTPFEDVDPSSIPQQPTYSEHVRPRMDYFCTGCHDRDSAVGAAEGVDLSTYDAVRAAVPAIELEAVTKRSMPPGGAQRMQARDWAIIKRWSEVGYPE
jgi:uncharacterized membrane protein